MGVKIDNPREWTVFIEGTKETPPVEIRGSTPCNVVTISIGTMSDPAGRTLRLSVEDFIKAADNIRALSKYQATR